MSQALCLSPLSIHHCLTMDTEAEGVFLYSRNKEAEICQDNAINESEPGELEA